MRSQRGCWVEYPSQNSNFIEGKSRRTCIARSGSNGGKELGRYVGRVSCLGLVALGFMLVNPVARLEARAVEGEEDALAIEDGEIDEATAHEAAISTVNIAFSPSSGSTSLTPTTEAGLSALVSVVANVDIENSGGYSVYLGSSSVNLVGAQTGQTIPGVAGSTTFDNLQPNTWGYYAGVGSSVPSDATYRAISQGRGVAIFENDDSDISSDSRTFILGFAANVNTSIPADIYQNTVTLSVVSSPREISEQFLYDFGITKLQGMTTSICAAAPPGATAQLADARDGTKYWITKLADGNCWMTQNLDLNVGEEIGSSEMDSDWNWNRNSTYPPVATKTSVTSGTINNSATGTYSWDHGVYVLANPTVASECGSGKAGASACPAQFSNVGTRVASSDPNFYKKSKYTGTSGGDCSKMANSPMSTAASGECAQYDAHYTIGNHYQWNAATVSTGGTITSSQAKFSICPKNWRLPISNSTSEDSFAALISAGGIGGDVTKLASAPYFFVRGGYVVQDSSSLFKGTGNDGFYWSSTAGSSASRAYDLYFSGSSDVFPSDDDNRQAGLSIRCLAR